MPQERAFRMDAQAASRESLTRRWGSLFFLALVLLGVTLVQPYNNGPPIRSDGEGAHLWTYAFLKGDPSFSWFQGDVFMMGLIQPDLARHRFLCKYPPGVALVRLPLMALVVDPDRDGPPYSTGEHWMCLVASALALLGVAGLSLHVCERLGVSPPVRHVAVLLVTFGSGLFHYGTYDAAFSHIYSALGAAVLLWIAVAAVQDR